MIFTYEAPLQIPAEAIQLHDSNVNRRRVNFSITVSSSRLQQLAMSGVFRRQAHGTTTWVHRQHGGPWPYRQSGGPHKF